MKSIFKNKFFQGSLYLIALLSFSYNVHVFLQSQKFNEIKFYARTRHIDLKKIDDKARLVFDEGFYSKKYVIQHNHSGTIYDHFVKVGWQLGNKPNEKFDTPLYVSFFTRPEFKDEFQLFPSPLHYYIYLKEFNTSKLKQYNVDLDHIKKKVKVLDNPKYYLTVCTVFQNEARFLKEWIEFYLIQGVEHFYLFNHNSKDDFKSVLQPYIDKGIVTLETITTEIVTMSDFEKLVHCKTFMDLCNKVKDEVEWIMLLDSDEYIFPYQGKSLANALKDYDTEACLRLPWVLFGTSNVEKIPDNELMVEHLTKSMHITNTPIGSKMIVKPRYLQFLPNPHYPVMQMGYYDVDENKVPCEGKSDLNSVITKIFRMNHYWSKDEKFFNEVKLPLWPEQNNMAKKKIYNKTLSLKEDDAILRFVPDLKKRMGFKH